MVFKEQHKTALAKILSDITQCDGIVNQGEIDFLQKAYKVFRIPLTCRKKATHLSLSEAVRMLKSLGKREKISILWAFQNLSVSDDSLDPNESLFLTALLLSIGIELPETEHINASFVSIPNLNFDTRNAVLYAEAEYDKTVNDSIRRNYKAICQLLKNMGHEFFYLPHVVSDLEKKKATFRNALNYLEPTLSEEQLDHIDRNLTQLDSAFLSKEIFLNYLKTNGLNITKPSFFMNLGSNRQSQCQDFLIIEIENSPLKTLERIVWLNANILKLRPPIDDSKEARMFQRLSVRTNKKQKDELLYTGFHKVIIDTLLKYNVFQETSRLFVTSQGNIYLTDKNNTEVKMPALCKALYIFFLLNKDGLSLNYLSDYKEELYRIYRRISIYGDDELLEKAVDNLTDFVGSTMNTNLSRIRKAFRDILGDEADIYLIKGEKGGRKAIHLNPDLIVFEDRKVFE